MSRALKLTIFVVSVCAVALVSWWLWPRSVEVGAQAESLPVLEPYFLTAEEVGGERVTLGRDDGISATTCQVDADLLGHNPRQVAVFERGRQRVVMVVDPTPIYDTPEKALEAIELRWNGGVCPVGHSSDERVRWTLERLPDLSDQGYAFKAVTWGFARSGPEKREVAPLSPAANKDLAVVSTVRGYGVIDGYAIAVHVDSPDWPIPAEYKDLEELWGKQVAKLRRYLANPDGFPSSGATVPVSQPR